MPTMQSPTSAGGLPEVPVTEIFEALGVPETMCTPEYVEHIVGAAIGEFADGEVEAPHEPLEDAVSRRYYGESHYGQGELGPLLRSALEGNDRALCGKVDSLIRHAARVFAGEVISGASTLPPHENARILPAVLPLPSLWSEQAGNPVLVTAERLHKAGYALLDFDGKVAQLAHRPQFVVDYGPGLQGRHKVDAQYQMLMQRHRPFVYAAIGKGPFINEFLQSWWRRRLTPDYESVWFDAIRGGLYIGREDGIAEASRHIVYDHPDYPDGAPPMADLVLASGIHTAGYETVRADIQNAYRMLIPLGALLLRAPQQKNVEGAEVSIEDMQSMAAEAGFNMRQAQVRDTATRRNEATAPIASRAVLIYK